jgi:predicted nucleic acid-binding protein
MPRRVYDTRFFAEYFFSKDDQWLSTLRASLADPGDKLISVVTQHELYRISLKTEGREVADLRSQTLRRDFTNIDVDYDLAIRAAELRHGRDIPMADSVIAATALSNRCRVITDDPHFGLLEGVKIAWF